MESVTILRLFICGGYGHHDFFVLMFSYVSTISTLTPSRALFSSVLIFWHTTTQPTLFLHSYLWAYVIKCSYFEMHHLPKPPLSVCPSNRILPTEQRLHWALFDLTTTTHTTTTMAMQTTQVASSTPRSSRSTMKTISIGSLFASNWPLARVETYSDCTRTFTTFTLPFWKNSRSSLDVWATSLGSFPSCRFPCRL